MKFILTVTCVYLFHFTLVAQSLVPRVGASITMNTLATKNNEVTPGAGFVIGLGYNHPIFKNGFIQFEVNSVQKSFNFSYKERAMVPAGTDVYIVDKKTEDHINISYLEMPLLLKMNFSKKLFLIVGPTLAVAVGGTHKFKEETTSSYFGNSQSKGQGDVKFGKESADNFNDLYFDNRWDRYIMLGLGTNIKTLLIEVRYNSGVNLLDNKSSRNRTIQLNLSIPIDLRKKEKA